MKGPNTTDETDFTIHSTIYVWRYCKCTMLKNGNIYIHFCAKKCCECCMMNLKAKINVFWNFYFQIRLSIWLNLKNVYVALVRLSQITFLHFVALWDVDVGHCVINRSVNCYFIFVTGWNNHYLFVFSFVLVLCYSWKFFG